MMSLPRKCKMMHYINFRMKCELQDGRLLEGTLHAYDKHMNLLLGDCLEMRTCKARPPQLKRRQEKRMLGFLLLRGEHLVSMTVAGPPAPEDACQLPPAGLPGGVGKGRAAGRGVMQASSAGRGGHGTSGSAGATPELPASVRSVAFGPPQRAMVPPQRALIAQPRGVAISAPARPTLAPRMGPSGRAFPPFGLMGHVPHLRGHLSGPLPRGMMRGPMAMMGGQHMRLQGPPHN